MSISYLILITRFFPVLILFCGVLANAQTAIKPSNKIITPYPGSIPELFMDVNNKVPTVFYSKDAFNRVNTFYEVMYGKPFSDNPNVNRYYAEGFNVKSDTGKNAYSGPSITIMLRSADENFYVTQALAHLKTAFISRGTGKSPTHPELVGILGQYEHLKYKFYSKTPYGKEGNDGYKGIEEVLYEKYIANPEEKRKGEILKLQEGYNKLVLEGKITEAIKLSEQINAMSSNELGATEKFNLAIQYLKEIEKIAFPTMIIIKQ